MAGMEQKLDREFYLQDARTVARQLLGRELVRESPAGRTSGIIVETEAYLGIIDRASHAFGGRLSKRTSVMYEEGGVAYIYFIYGMYWCLNVVTREAGIPEAVLIRGIEPLEGTELMAQRRGTAGKNRRNLTNGPGKLCLAFDIKGDLNGEDLTGKRLYIREPLSFVEGEVVTAPRVNIDYAGDDRHHEWRYYLSGNPYVSRK